MVERFQNYIGGKFVDAGDGRTFDSLDPYAGEAWAAIPEGSTEDIDHAVAAARSALQGEWGKMTGFQRAALMRRLADLITENAERLARVEVRDNGKLYREMIGQLQGLAPGTSTSPGTRTRSRAGSSRPTSPTTSASPAASRSAWSARSRRGTPRCCS
jgi:acyl-CoA reductase-like NAD-dependent aldehyde dehydrogenase